MVFVNSLFVVNGADFTGTKNRVPRMHCTYYAMSSIIDAVHCAVHVHECAALSKHTKQAIGAPPMYFKGSVENWQIISHWEKRSESRIRRKTA